MYTWYIETAVVVLCTELATATLYSYDLERSTATAVVQAVWFYSYQIHLELILTAGTGAADYVHDDENKLQQYIYGVHMICEDCFNDINEIERFCHFMKTQDLVLGSRRKKQVEADRLTPTCVGIMRRSSTWHSYSSLHSYVRNTIRCCMRQCILL